MSFHVLSVLGSICFVLGGLFLGIGLTLGYSRKMAKVNAHWMSAQPVMGRDAA